ncbi:MAG: hypothetical protein QXO27_03920 [Candidatus Aenigmatarchaeota archaeon]
MSAKGQVFSTDFVIACSIFILAIGAIFVYWRYVNTEIQDTRVLIEMSEKLYLVSQIWFREGVPEYWSPDSVIELGLQNNHELNQTKMNNLNLIGYSKFLNLVGSENYYVYYRLRDEKNSTLFTFGYYPNNEKNVMKLERIGILNQTIVIIEVLLWR